jgi:hypothetical protein
MDSAQVPSPQLGRILVAAGLLTEEQLEKALEEQEQTSARLGEIIVRRGFVSGPALANALAEQHGGLLKTEYGYATGLGGDVAKRAASGEEPPPPPMPKLRTVEPLATPEPEPAPAPEPEPEVVEPEPEPVPQAAEPVPEPEAELRKEPEPVHFPEPEPDPEPVRLADPQPQPPPEPVADARDDLIAELRARLEVQEAELVALREALERERSRRGQLEPAVVAKPVVEPEPDEQPQPEAPEPAPAEEPAAAPAPGPVEHFLLCVPTEAGYVLLDRVGKVPAVGEDVEVPEEGGTFSVTKVVRLPRNGRPCAYLQRDRPAA